MTTYQDQGAILEQADALDASHLTIEINEGEFKMTRAEAHETFAGIGPGEPFEIKAMHWDEPGPILHFSGSDPTPEEREELERLHLAYREAEESPSSEQERFAAAKYIESLMRYAGISEA